MKSKDEALDMPATRRTERNTIGASMMVRSADGDSRFCQRIAKSAQLYIRLLDNTGVDGARGISLGPIADIAVLGRRTTGTGSNAKSGDWRAVRFGSRRRHRSNPGRDERFPGAGPGRKGNQCGIG